MSTSTSPSGAPWARPFARLDQVMTRTETWIVTSAIALEMLAMSLWVVLKGLSTPVENASHGGVIIRAVIGAVALGVGAQLAFAKKSPAVRERAVLLAAVVGLLAAKAWAGLGVSYAGNLLNWFQQASFLTLLGGLRGTGTRLTLLLALVGGSLATARGKHIVIDVTARLARGRAKTAFVVTGFTASAAVALAAAWGFFDHIAIENFSARAGMTAAEKARSVVRGLGEDAFAARAQLRLDAKSFPHVVLRAEPYAEWLRGAEWDAFLTDAGFVDRYGPSATGALRMPDAESRAPLVSIPGRGEPRGELINAANLIFPLGLLVIGLRFLLRGVLILTGHAGVEPDEETAPLAAKEA